MGEQFVYQFHILLAYFLTMKTYTLASSIINIIVTWYETLPEIQKSC